MHYLTAFLFLFGSSIAIAQKNNTITFDNTSGLSFGSFSAGTGGTVSVSTSGGRSKSGGVVLVSSSAGTAAQFTITSTSTKNTTYSITLPANGTVVLKNSNNNTMLLNNFLSNPTTPSNINKNTPQTLSVGATLVVGNAQAPGNYTGSFAVTVNY